MVALFEVNPEQPETERIEGTVVSLNLEKNLRKFIPYDYLVLKINEENSATPKYPERLARYPFGGGIFGLLEVQNVLFGQKVEYKVRTFPGDDPTEYSLEIYSGPLKGRICKETISYNSPDVESPSDEERCGLGSSVSD